MTRRRGRWAGGAAAALAAVLGVGCGGTTDQQPTWVAGHPDTALLSFKLTAPGVCAITVRYPDLAPAAIDYLGMVYVQVMQLPHATPGPGARVIDHTGDWQVTQQGTAGDLLLLTPSSTYDYRPETHC